MIKILNIYLLSLFIIIVISIIYVEFTLVHDDQSLKYYLKWIPGFFMAITAIFTLILKINHDLDYVILTTFGFIFCTIGDILFLSESIITFGLGMLFFAIAYVFFGLNRFEKTYSIKKNSKQKINMIVGSLFYLLVATPCIVSLIATIINDAKNYYLATSVGLYSLVVSLSFVVNCFSLLLNNDIRSFFSMVGVFLFMISDIMLILNKINFNNNLYMNIAVILCYWYGLTMILFSVYFIDKTDRSNDYDILM